MGKYEDDPEVRQYIDERLQEIHEKIYPILNGTDCTVTELRAGIKREKKLISEIKAADKEFHTSIWEI